MAIPSYQSLMLPVLQCVANGAEWSRSKCVEKLVTTLGITEEDLSVLLPSGSESLFSNRVAWAISYLKKAILIESTRWGFFKITDRGVSLLKGNPQAIDNNYLLQYPEFKTWFQARSSQAGVVNPVQSVHSSEEKSPEELIQGAYQNLFDQLKSDLLDYLYSDRVSPSLFEKIIVDLLIAMNYGGGRAEMGKALGRSNDGGVDGVVMEDALGLDVVYIQAKKYAADNVVGRPQVQNFVGSLEGFNATKGVFVTTSYFAATAYDYVSRVHKRIVLIDGGKLAELMIQHGIGVRLKESIDIKKLDEDYFS